MRLDLELGNEMMPSSSEPGTSAILSPDGRRLVYLSRSKLFVRQLDQPTARELPGTENAGTPFFSPDGRWVGFFEGENLRKVSLQGGAPILLSKCSIGKGGSWGEDGSVVAGCSFALSKVPAAGGAPQRLTELARGEIAHRWPQLLPGDKALLFTAYPAVTGLDGATIEVLSLKDRRRKTLVRGGGWGRYLASGHLVYVDKGTLFAVPFDSDRLELHGTPKPVLGEVAYSTTWGSAQIDSSQTGTLVYRSSKAGEGLVTVQWLDPSGNARPLLPVPGNYLSPTLSPDGSRLALTSEGDIWVYELRRASMTRLTFGGGYGSPLWTVDSKYILFRAAHGMLWTRADGTAQPQVLTESSNQQTPWSFTADGRHMAFV
jgi:serine/threonine-protein kinase